MNYLRTFATKQKWSRIGEIDVFYFGIFTNSNRHGFFINCFHMSLGTQIIWLFVLAIPIACIAWTVTHEEVFREPREYCIRRSKEGKTILTRKIFYLFTCEYCFSHYVTALMLLMTGYQLLFNDWRGYIIAGFALVWIANLYMSLFGLLRMGIKVERLEADMEDEILTERKREEERKKGEHGVEG